MQNFEFDNDTQTDGRSWTGLIPEIFSINIKEKISNVSEDSIRHTFTIY